jgi:hypothetical protein
MKIAAMHLPLLRRRRQPEIATWHALEMLQSNVVVPID